MSISGTRLSEEKIFRADVRRLSVKVATQISGTNEADKYTDSGQEKRQQLCNNVLSSPDSYVGLFAIIVVTNPAIDDTSDDADIEYTINNNWDQAATVLFSEKIPQ